MIIGFFQSLWIIAWFRPDVVLAKGGYVCLPMGIAAWCLRIPLVIHDSDTRPGLTNKVLAHFATKIATGFPLENYQYPAQKSTYIGVPIDDTFRPVDDKQQRQSKRDIGLSPDETVIVAFGGGLGSARINDAMPALAYELGEGFVVYNITGKNNIDRAQKKGKGIANYHPVGFVYGMYATLAAADLVITRASATSLQELAGLRKTVVAVPAKQLGDQLKNAQVFSEADAVIVAQDDELDSTAFQETIKSLLHDEAQRDRLARNIYAFARPEAAKVLADMVATVRD